MRINADATGGSLRVELVDPFDRILPGFGKDDCVEFSGDETDHPLQWRDASLEEMVSQARGGFKVKIYLDRARLFALYAS